MCKQSNKCKQCVDNKQTRYHHKNASIKTIRYWNGTRLVNRSTLSPQIIYKRDRDSISTLERDGLIINLPYEPTVQIFSLNKINL